MNVVLRLVDTDGQQTHEIELDGPAIPDADDYVTVLHRCVTGMSQQEQLDYASTRCRPSLRSRGRGSRRPQSPEPSDGLACLLAWT
jgi:hypothetical protein